jgi:predicted nucleic acid-binding protein
MNGIDFFVDTNVLIYMLSGHPTAVKIAQHEFSLGVSVITEIELLGKKNVSRYEIGIIRGLLEGCEIIPLSNKIKDLAISIKQKYALKTPDAIVAATAKSFNLPLLTFDNDFKKIEGFEIIILDSI